MTCCITQGMCSIYGCRDPYYAARKQREADKLAEERAVKRQAATTERHKQWRELEAQRAASPPIVVERQRVLAWAIDENGVVIGRRHTRAPLYRPDYDV